MSVKKSPVITCGIYLFNTRSREILICHATHASWQKWTIPKGIKGRGEEPYAAALRELKEETGIDINKINVLKISPLPPAKYLKQNKILESFLVITDTDMDNYSFCCHSQINNEFPEIDNWRWVNPESVTKYLHESQQENIKKINELIKI